MPYIYKEARTAIDDGAIPSDPGELNYAITSVIKQYWSLPGDPSYRTINDILGALEGAKLEFVRRVVVPYEDKKIQSNGDIW